VGGNFEFRNPNSEFVIGWADGSSIQYRESSVGWAGGWDGYTPANDETRVLDEETGLSGGAQLAVTTTEAPLAFFLIDSMPFRQASLDL
jgi:hypothetical protein